MDGRKPSSKLRALFSGIFGVITALSWLGITPERVGQVAYDVLYPVLPFAAFGFGCLTGYFLRDYMKQRDAETAARIERENAEHAEKMRREREEYEAAKRAEEVRKAEEVESERIRECMISDFRHATPWAKDRIAQMYDEGSIEIREDSFRYYNLHKWADYTTLRTEYPSYHTIVKATLIEDVAKMLEENEYLLSERDE